jgi:hypothetical protein
MYTSVYTAEWDEVATQLYCAPRYDLHREIVPNEPDKTSAYELDFRRSNPSPIVKEVQQSMKTLLAPKAPDDIIVSLQNLSKRTPSGISFEKASREDLEECYNLDIELYGIGESNPLSVRQARYDKVPDGFYVLRHNGKLVGHTSFVPIDPSELRRARAGIPGRIPMESIYPISIGRSLDVYFIIMSTRESGVPGLRYGEWLLKGLMEVFFQMGLQGVEIKHVFANSRTEGGKRICRGLGMEEEPWANEPERSLFSLDIQTSRSLHIAKRYQEGLAEYRASLMREETL